MVTRVKVVEDFWCSQDPYPDDFKHDEPYQTQPDEYEQHTILGIREVEGDNYGDIDVGFDIVPSEEYYLLYGVYSTGDSFSHTEGKVEFVDLYEDREVAEENAKRLRKHNDHGEDKFSCKLIHESGKEYDYCVPWKGYFEQLSCLEVEPVQVTSESSRF